MQEVLNVCVLLILSVLELVGAIEGSGLSAFTREFNSKEKMLKVVHYFKKIKELKGSCIS